MLNQSRPLLLLVATLCLLMVALSGFWLAYLPRHLTEQMQQSALANGLQFSSTAKRLAFTDGLSLEYEGVTLSSPSKPELGLLSARTMRVGLGLNHIFGFGNAFNDVELQAPLLDLNTQALQFPSAFSALNLKFRDGIVRFRDPSLQSTISLRELNGTVTIATNGTSRVVLSGLLNDVLADVAVDVEDIARVGNSGSPVDASLNTKTVNVSYSGRLKAAGPVQLDGQLIVDAPDVRDATQLLGMTLKSISDGQQLHAEAGVSTVGSSADLNFGQLQIGPSIFKGKTLLKAGPDRIAWSGELSVDQLDVLSMPSATPSLANRWRESILPFSDLLALDADLDIIAKSSRMGHLDMGPAKTHLKIKDGALAFDLASEAFAGGTAQFTMTLNHGRESTGATLKASGQKLDASKLLGDGLGLQTLQGAVDLDLDLTATGNSVASFISTLAGTINLNAPDAKLSGLDAKDVLTTVGTGWRSAPGKSTAPLRLSFGAKVVEGVATLSNTTLAAPGVSLKPTGEIDVLRQDLAIQLAPKLSLKGNWSAPSVQSSN
jgi:AsmA-like C-terminal region